MARRATLAAGIALAALLLAPGCAVGLIYTDVVVPLDRDLDGTPIQQEQVAPPATSDIRLEFSSVRVEWGDTGIVNAARQAGLSEIHYADLHTVSILGIWTQRFALVYGRRAP